MSLRKLLAVTVTFAAAWMIVESQACASEPARLNVYDWDGSHAAPVGQIVAISTAQTGAQHYSYSSASAHPSGVSLAYTRSNIWVHENSNNGEFSFGFVFAVDNGGSASNNVSLNFRIVDSSSDPYVSQSDDPGEAVESPAGSNAFVGNYYYVNNTDGICVSGITGLAWTIVIDAVDFGNIVDWWAASGEAAGMDDDIQLALGHEYRIVPEGTTPFGGEVNPAVPAGPNPADEAVDVAVDADLAWQVEEPAGLTYDVYFGTAADPPQVSTGQAELSYTPSLAFNTTYHWKVVSHSGATTFESKVWSFTTIALPDLTIVSADAPSLVGNRQDVTLTWRTENHGTLATPAGWTEKVLLSQDETAGVEDTEVTVLTQSNMLAPAAGADRTVDVELPDMPEGAYYVLFVADADGELVEQDEANNVRAVPIEIRQPPSVVSQEPERYTNQAVSTMTLTLSAPVVGDDARAPNTYLLMDLGADRAPGGGDDVAITVTPAYVDGTTQIDLQPAGVLSEGAYQLTVTSGAPGIRDTDGVPLDGDGDGKGGDNYVATFTVDQTPPTVADVTIQSDQIQVGYYDFVGMDEATVTDTANYTLLGSGGDGTLADGNEIDLAGRIANITYEAGDAGSGTATLALAPPLPDDVYQLTINGTDSVADLAGNALAGDHVAELRLETGPAVVALDVDASTDTGASDSDKITNNTEPLFNVTVDRPGRIGIDFDGDGAEDANLLVDRTGTYQFTSDTLAEGNHTAAATLQPAVGDEAADALALTIDTRGPSASSTTSTKMVATSQWQVTFDEDIDPATAGGQDATLYGPGDVLLGAATGFSGSGTEFTVAFSPQRADGAYRLAVGPNIRDIAGNDMNQNGNLTNGEDPDDVHNVTFSLAVGPRIIGYSPTLHVDLAAVTLDSVSVTFDEAIDFVPAGGGTFTVDDVTIIGPQGAVTPTGIASSGGNQYEISFDPQTDVGRYTVSVGPAIADLNGNELDLDQDGNQGEAGDDVYTFSFFAVRGDTVFNSPATIQADDATYDGTDIVVDGTTVTINGSHTFSSVSVVNGGI